MGERWYFFLLSQVYNEQTGNDTKTLKSAKAHLLSSSALPGQVRDPDLYEIKKKKKQFHCGETQSLLPQASFMFPGVSDFTQPHGREAVGVPAGPWRAVSYASFQSRCEGAQKSSGKELLSWRMLLMVSYTIKMFHA